VKVVVPSGSTRMVFQFSGFSSTTLNLSKNIKTMCVFLAVEIFVKNFHQFWGSNFLLPLQLHYITKCPICDPPVAVLIIE
jgi:hypothetical protein